MTENGVNVKKPPTHVSAAPTHCLPFSFIEPRLHFKHFVPSPPVLQTPFKADLLRQGYVLLLEATVEDDVASQRCSDRLEVGEHQEYH